MKWTGIVPLTGDMRSAFNVLVGKLEGRDHFENLGLDGMMY
jgi:hypothetical protein